MKRYKQYGPHQTETRLIQMALQQRATDKAGLLQHELGLWNNAKQKKHGPDALQAFCTQCGAVVVVMPRHWQSLEHQQVPAMKGDALFNSCVGSRK